MKYKHTTPEELFAMALTHAIKVANYSYVLGELDDGSVPTKEDKELYAKDYSDYAEYLMSLISIPKNATNEDVLKIVFPNWGEEISTNGESLILERFTPYCKMQLHKDWLNAPYKKGDNNE